MSLYFCGTCFVHTCRPHTLILALRLRSLASSCTIVNTIHQPQAKIFRLFDKLILLKWEHTRGGDSNLCSGDKLPGVDDHRS